MNIWTILRLMVLLGIALGLSACDDDATTQYTPVFIDTPPTHANELIFGVHPLHNPTRLLEVFGPLVDYLNRNISGVSIKLEASRNYASYDEKLYAGYFHLALPNPFQTIQALDKGYQIVAKMGDDQNFRGIILVRKDSNINYVSDLKGKAVSFPAPTALAATMMPQYYLQTHGLKVMQDIDIRYVGSQESSIMNVYLGNTAAAATWPPPWRALSKERPELAKALEVKWQTESLPNNSLMARDDVEAGVVERVRELILQLHTQPEGRHILERMELSRFEAAGSSTYQPVREFIQKFRATVREVE